MPPGFATIWSAVAIDLVGFGIVFPILPLYAKRFHASSAAATGLVAAFAAASFVFSPVWGRLSDRYGRKPVLLLSLVGTCAGSLMTALAGGLAVLYLARVVDGISGASVSVAQASVSDVASPDQRARLFGLLGAAFGLGFVAGPAIGALAQLAGPKVPFYVAAALAGVNALVALRRLPETHPRSRSVPEAAGSVAPAPSGRRGWWGRGPFSTLAGGHGVGVFIAVAFGTLVAFSAFEATFALFGQRRLGFGLGSSAAVFAVIGLAIVAVQVGLVHGVVSWLGEEATLRLGLVVVGAGLLGLAFVRSWAALAGALLALTVGEGLAQTTMASALAGRADPGRRGEVLGAQQSAGGLARVIGPLLGGIAFERIGPGAPYIGGAALVAVVVVVLQAAVGTGLRRSRDPNEDRATARE